jgi:NADH-quinone oxidoreductase subunit N
VLGRQGDGDHDLSRYKGLAGRQPVLALCFAVLLLAQAGAPFTTGLWAKVQVVFAAIDVGDVPLAVIAMVTAAIAAYFYLRVAVLMYAGGGLGEPEGGSVSGSEAPLHTGDASASAGPVSWAGPAGPDATASAVATLNERILLADEEPEDEELTEAVPVPALTTVGIGLCTGVSVVFGFWPQPLIDFANHATLLFLSSPK